MNKSICKRTKQEKYHLDALGCYTNLDLHISCPFFFLSRMLFYLSPMLINSLSVFPLFNTHPKYLSAHQYMHTNICSHTWTHIHTHTEATFPFLARKPFLYAPQPPGHTLVTASSTIFCNSLLLVASHFHLKDRAFICICMSSHQHPAWLQ